MNEIISSAAGISLLLLFGVAIGLARRDLFSFAWLLAAAGLVFLNDALLTNGYGSIPDLTAELEWNWQGKTLALLATLLVAALPAFGWRRCGLTLVQKPGSLIAAIPVAALYLMFFAALAWVFPSDGASSETIAFQMTMPGLEEELFYRGILLFALDRAFLSRVRFLGVDWGWGALLSCALFGLAHAFGYSDGAFHFDPMIMALTAIPSFIAVWLRLRTGSVLLPILLHNLGNSMSFIVGRLG